MKTYDSFEHFWHDFATLQSPNDLFDIWTIVNFTHTSDEEYDRAQTINTGVPGFQPLMLTLVNSFTHEIADVVIKHSNDQQAAQVKDYFRTRFGQQFSSRFGLFLPEKDKGSVEYANWDLFKQYWVESGGRNLLPFNIPLLFDHPTDLEYWSWQQQNTAKVNYQRLIVTAYQPRKRHVHDIFVQGVDEAAFADIKQTMQDTLLRSLREMF